MKLGVCVPYRNREAHLKEFVPKVGQYLENRGIDYCMYFGHQNDNKLFNRGAMKNVAAKAAFDDGCDYIVWHDIDMIPEEGGGADYSYPEEHPVHIATSISQMDYKLKYFEYFGGAVLFTREQVEKTNGYSNEYWDWGSEDDDLFWRCYLEGLADVKVEGVDFDSKYYHFTGHDSYLKIPAPYRNFTSFSHTIQITCRAFQQLNKVNMYLVGDRNRKYVEYPIFSIPGYDYGINFNNSKALDVQFWNTFNQIQYMWCKKYDQQWSTLTVTLDTTEQEARLYLNGKEVNSDLGEGSLSPLKWVGRLKRYGDLPIYLGTTPSVQREDPRRFFKGDIRELKIWNRVLTPEEIKSSFKNWRDNLDDCVLWLGDGKCSSVEEVQNINVEEKTEDITIVTSVLPFRKEGRFRCLPHKDEGIVGGRFVKGQPSADNESRYQTKMQQGQIDYKNDGYAQIEQATKLLNVEEIAPKAKMINVVTL